MTTEPDRLEALKPCLFAEMVSWLEACLTCDQFVWDGDQYIAARDCLDRARHRIETNARTGDTGEGLGVATDVAGLSPTVEPASSLAGFAASIPNAADYACAERANSMWGAAINGPHVAVLAAMLARVEAETAKSTAVEWCAYMDQAVSKAPEPLRKLGEYLSRILDEDRWPEAERYLNAVVLAKTEQMPVAYLYENEAFGKELVLDCNGEYARRLLELGYTETPLFAAQVGTRPQGEDCLQASSETSDAVAEGHAPLPLSQSITPPEVGGWDHRFRRLEEGELIEESDEHMLDDGSWELTNCAGQKAPDPNYTSHRWYRRLKVVPEVEGTTTCQSISGGRSASSTSIDARPADTKAGPEVGGELVERVARAIDPNRWSLRDADAGRRVEWDADIKAGWGATTFEEWVERWVPESIETARRVIAALSTPEVVDGKQVVRASAQEGTALSSQATEPQASPPCGLQSTDASGNWRAEFTDTPYAEIGEGWVVDSPEGSICTLDGPVAEREAHARLIAAAPEMLGALRELRRWKAFSHPDAAGAFTEANRIIAKAEAKS
jgi:hypothetical protein